MLCSEIMKSEIECLSPIDPADLAARKMRDHNVGFLPVCDEALHAVGTITDRDLAVRLVAQNLPLVTPVGELMSMDVVACRPTDHVRKAEELMGLHRVSRVLCVEDDGTLAGEWGRYGITVNAIAPGFFPSKMTKGLLEKLGAEKMAAHAPLRRLGDDDDLKGVALLFASAAGKHITGQTLAVDGGVSALTGG